MTIGLNEPIDTRVDDSHRTLRIIWLAILATVIGLFIVTRVVQPVSGGNLKMLFWILLAIGLANFGASFLLKQRLLKQAAEKHQLEQARTAYIVAFALCESIGLFGFIAYIITGIEQYYFFFVISGFGILLHKPQRDDLLAASGANKI